MDRRKRNRMSDKNKDYSIIEEIYLENEGKLRDLKLSQMLLQVEIKNNEQMILQEEEKKDPNRGIFHTVEEHVFSKETDRMRKELFTKKEELASLDAEIARYEDKKQRLHEVKKALYSSVLKENDLDQEDAFDRTQLLMIQERDRNRIAADLHDSTVQSMTALVHKVELIERFLDIDRTRAFVELSGMKDTIRSMIQEMREIIYDLRPMSLENLGLWMSVKEMLDLVQKRHNIQTQFLVEESILQYRPEEIVEINLFRMVQEIVNNSVKHSGAASIVVSITKKEDFLLIEVSDDGVGMSKCQASKERNFGIQILHERANIINAELIISNGKNGGAVILIKLPLAI